MTKIKFTKEERKALLKAAYDTAWRRADNSNRIECARAARRAAQTIIQYVEEQLS